MFLVKTDFGGDSLWSKFYGTPNNDYIEAVRQTSDKGFVMLGRSPATGAEIILVRTDAAADPIWTKTFTLPNSPTPLAVTTTKDGGFVVAGESKLSAVYTSVFLMKVDANGNAVWTKTYNLGKAVYGSTPTSIQETATGALIVAGVLYPDTTGSAAFLFNASATGDSLWIQTYGHTNATTTRFSSLSLTSDGGFIACGFTNMNGSDVFIVRTDADGVAAWSKTFGGAAYEESNSTAQTFDGGFMVGAYTTSFPAGGYDYYLLKISATGTLRSAAILRRNRAGSVISDIRSRFHPLRCSRIRVAQSRCQRFGLLMPLKFHLSG